MERLKQYSEKNKTHTLKYISHVNWDSVEEVLERVQKYYINSSWANYDYSYRIYHASFKMYYMADSVLELWEELLSVYNIEKFKTEQEFYESEKLEKSDKPLYYKKKFSYVMKNLRKLGINPMLDKQLMYLKDKVFTLNKNHGNWGKEGIIMAGVYKISQEIVESALMILLQWKNRDGILWTDSRTLTEREALVMSTLSFLNIRHYDNQDREQKIRESIEKNTEKQK